MKYRDRIMAAIEHRPVDRLPVDIWCVDEVRQRLLEYAGTDEWLRVLDYLDIDGIISIRPPYIGPTVRELDGGHSQNEWGMVYREQVYAAGVYREQVGYPLADARTISDIDAYRWPDPGWYDYSVLSDLAAACGDRAVEVGYTAIFYFHNQLRGLEQSLMDPLLYPEFTHHLLRRLSDFFLEYHERCFAAVRGAAQITQVTDDFGSQKGLLISKDMLDDFYRPWIQRAIDQAKRCGLKVFHHDDGAICSLIPDLVEMGIDVLNPIQWRCQGMDREAIGDRFAGKVCFHGGIDNQQTLPFGTPDDVREEVAYNIRTLGRTGSGYIIAPCHNLQANTPLENILALYSAPRVTTQPGYCR